MPESPPDTLSLSRLVAFIESQADLINGQRYALQVFFVPKAKGVMLIESHQLIALPPREDKPA